MEHGRAGRQAPSQKRHHTQFLSSNCKTYQDRHTQHDHNPIVCATRSFIYSDWFCCLTRHGRGCLQVIITAACVSTLQQSTQREQRKFFAPHKHDDQNPTPTELGDGAINQTSICGSTYNERNNRATLRRSSQNEWRLCSSSIKRLHANRVALDCVRTESTRANDEPLPPFCLVINRRARKSLQLMNEVAKMILADGVFCNSDVIFSDTD